MGRKATGVTLTPSKVKTTPTKTVQSKSQSPKTNKGSPLVKQMTIPLTSLSTKALGTPKKGGDPSHHQPQHPQVILTAPSGKGGEVSYPVLDFQTLINHLNTVANSTTGKTTATTVSLPLLGSVQLKDNPREGIPKFAIPLSSTSKTYPQIGLVPDLCPSTASSSKNPPPISLEVKLDSSASSVLSVVCGSAVSKIEKVENVCKNKKEECIIVSALNPAADLNPLKNKPPSSPSPSSPSLPVQSPSVPKEEDSTSSEPSLVTEPSSMPKSPKDESFPQKVQPTCTTPLPQVLPPPPSPSPPQSMMVIKESPNETQEKEGHTDGSVTDLPTTDPVPMDAEQSVSNSPINKERNPKDDNAKSCVDSPKPVLFEPGPNNSTGNNNNDTGGYLATLAATDSVDSEQMDFTDAEKKEEREGDSTETPEEETPMTNTVSDNQPSDVVSSTATTDKDQTTTDMSPPGENASNGRGEISNTFDPTQYSFPNYMYREYNFRKRLHSADKDSSRDSTPLSETRSTASEPPKTKGNKKARKRSSKGKSDQTTSAPEFNWAEYGVYKEYNLRKRKGRSKSDDDVFGSGRMHGGLKSRKSSVSSEKKKKKAREKESLPPSTCAKSSPTKMPQEMYNFDMNQPPPLLLHIPQEEPNPCSMSVDDVCAFPLSSTHSNTCSMPVSESISKEEEDTLSTVSVPCDTCDGESIYQGEYASSLLRPPLSCIPDKLKRDSFSPVSLEFESSPVQFNVASPPCPGELPITIDRMENKNSRFFDFSELLSQQQEMPHQRAVEHKTVMALKKETTPLQNLPSKGGTASQRRHSTSSTSGSEFDIAAFERSLSLDTFSEGSLSVQIPFKLLPNHSVVQCYSANGFKVGDVVWAKAYQLPAWPGKIIKNTDWTKDTLGVPPPHHVSKRGACVCVCVCCFSFFFYYRLVNWLSSMS